MTQGIPLAYPGGQFLGAWWRQLGSFRLQSLWLAYLDVHRVEACVRVRRFRSLDTFERALIQALAAEPAVSLNDLCRHFHLGVQEVSQFVRRFVTDGLAKPDEPGTWRITELGELVRKRDGIPQIVEERRPFFFVDRGPSVFPQFLPLVGRVQGTSFAPSEGWKFPLEALERCIDQPESWKHTFGFPNDVEAVLTLGDPAAETRISPWRNVAIDYPVRIFAVLGVSGEKTEMQRLLGFEVQPKTWSLVSTKPIIDLARDWQKVFPDLKGDPGRESWSQAWNSWVEACGVPGLQSADCRLERRQHRLRVTAPRLFVERLRQSRMGVLVQDYWLLAGNERLKQAALLELVTGS